jgi:hypothetical protein
MVNFPAINSYRSPVDNNKIRQSGGVKATQESAATAAAKKVANSHRRDAPERRRHHDDDPSGQGQGNPRQQSKHDDGHHPGELIDIEV